MRRSMRSRAHGTARREMPRRPSPAPMARRSRSRDGSPAISYPGTTRHRRCAATRTYSASASSTPSSCTAWSPIATAPCSSSAELRRRGAGHAALQGVRGRGKARPLDHAPLHGLLRRARTAVREGQAAHAGDSGRHEPLARPMGRAPAQHVAMGPRRLIRAHGNRRRRLVSSPRIRLAVRSPRICRERSPRGR